MSKLSQKPFYNKATEAKLQVIEKYLASYLSVMKNQSWSELIYVDAFAGSGNLPSANDPGFLGSIIDADNFVLGSASRALALKQKFGRYIFIEKDKAKIAELEVLRQANPSSNVVILNGDANEELLKLCPLLSQSHVRSVVFLDPFGNQVSWELLAALASTERVDLWYLFPAMLGVYRQIGKSDARIDLSKEASLSKLFGPHNWRDAFIEKHIDQDLFGDRETERKIADVDDITRFKIKCLKTIFKGGVSDKWLPLGRNGAHWYSLLFAMANPSPQAVKAGHAIANSIMTRK